MQRRPSHLPLRMKHSLQLRLSQHLTLTPQLQQSIRLLQLSTLELNQELERFLQENPLLERDEGPAEQPINVGADGAGAEAGMTEVGARPAEGPEGTHDEDAFGSLPETSYGNGAREDGDDEDYPQVAAESPTLRAHLIGQLSLLNLSERDR